MIEVGKLSTADLLRLQSEARDELTRRYGLDPRHPYEDRRDLYWASLGDVLVYAETPEAVQWGAAYKWGAADPILETPEPVWYSAPIVGDVVVQKDGLAIFLVDHEDGGYGYLWLSREHRVVDAEEGT